MQIRQTKDYEIITKLSKHVHDIHTDHYPEYFKEYDYDGILAFFKSVINKENTIFLLAEQENQPIGYAYIEIRNYAENVFKKAYQSIYVHQFCITNTKRNQGYGTRLMNEIGRIAKEKGIHKIELDYWANNENAKHFYKKNGFTLYREFVYKDIH